MRLLRYARNDRRRGISGLPTIFVIYCLLLPMANSFGIEINLRLDKNRIVLGDAVTLEITVTGAGSFGKPKIEIPSDIAVHSQSESQRVEVVNWQMNRSLVYTLLLVPSRAGSFTLGPAKLDTGGRVLPSNKETLEVIDQKSTSIPGTPQGITRPFISPQFKRSVQDMLTDQQQQTPAKQQAKSSPAKESARAEPPFVFLDTKISKKEAYVGEPVEFSVLFYSRVPFLSQPQYTPPPITGFWKEDLPQKNYNATVEGVNYSVTEIPMVLFPQTPGKLEIGSAKIAIEIENSPTGGPTDPFDPQFFQRFFAMNAGETKVLSTKRLDLSAVPIPEEGKPKDFSGAVGHYEISASVDKHELKVGESLTLTVRVSGEGNIKGLPSPYYPNLEGTFRSYETEKSETVDTKGPSISGAKTFKLLLIPQIPGKPDLTIAPLRFVYFDPQTKTYVRKETPPITVKVSGEPITQNASTGAGFTPETKKLTDDIEYIETAEPKISLYRLTVAKAAKRWPWPSALPVALWASTALFGFIKKHRDLRKKHPLEQLQNALTLAARQALEDHGREGMEILSGTFLNALANILKLPTSKLSVRLIEVEIAKKLPKEDAALIKKTLHEIEFLRFAHASQKISKEDLTAMVNQIREAKKILEKLA